MIARFGLLLTLLWLGSACATLAPREPLALDDPQVARALAALEANAAQRQSLRAVVKIAIDGPRGSARAKQVLLVKRPASLRIEVFGVMNQIVSLLVTDGENFSAYDAGRQTLERGAVHEGLLRQTTGVDLTPHEVVQLLLAEPVFPSASLRIVSAARLRGGGLELVVEDAALAAARDAIGDFTQAAGASALRATQRRFEFDAAFRLVRTSVIAADGVPLWEAVFSDFPMSAAEAKTLRTSVTVVPEAEFPRRMELRMLQDGIRVELQFSELELNRKLDENLFKL